ncbi:hypothetical protein [Gordonia alkanivorans]|uniref:hypothetical protein n=1 Tax=Gordonia alkanivorans TaxID=84096 RepID=UPI002447E85B|nr:hypothetical protein [Gordonia alkanivorans]MDH3021150.1 hypothetical protein [Gordonia alkanivorans]MDJ0010394.1 hypothetical protein [Gordonia alkanivorans]MDJ0099910.1 hypothetical protein [Gordonia alkanivorans]MDJ0496028.1 hypothetical protein [Gordonia alkanivorans]
MTPTTYLKAPDGQTRRDRLLAALTYPQWLRRDDCLDQVWPAEEPRPKNYKQSLRNILVELKKERRIEVLDVGPERFVRLRVSRPTPTVQGPTSEGDDDKDFSDLFEDD